ncbi:conserved hypothetical protein [Culex quinquefasciatus]|uniref:Uncharacterized protein n=1 Tax=Culex quinquefasciatus TaxID=7176 RepID=B0W1R2_CULQU|nr:conserved hypothetical protein [Culex quinquefasciatus]|eukprot:XP_001842646.1 conserved hypothetical protein [Culex quinquefasciatus]
MKPPAWKKDKQSPVVPSFSAADFLPLPVPIPDKLKKTDTQSAADAGRSQGNTGPGAGGQPKAKGDEVLYSTEELLKMFLGELWKMFYEFTARLRSFKDRSDQETVVGSMSGVD